MNRFNFYKKYDKSLLFSMNKEKIWDFTSIKK